MTTLLITGANRGLGLEFTRQYLADGHKIIACCRKPADAKELQSLAEKSGGRIRLMPLEVSDSVAVERLALELKNETIDILINNAGVFGDHHDESLKNISPENWMQVFRVNTIAPLVVARAFLPHVARSASKKFVFITSKMGSIDDNTSGGYYLYRSSKAALNMAVKSFAIDTTNQNTVAIVMHPGWVQTDMGGKQAPLKPFDSISHMKKTIEKITAKDSGKFLNYDGAEISW